MAGDSGRRADDDHRVMVLERAVLQDPSDLKALEAYLSLWRRLGRRDPDNPLVVEGLKRLADAGPRPLDHYYRLEAAWIGAERRFGGRVRAEDHFVFTNGEGTWPLHTIAGLGSLAVAAIDRALKGGDERQQYALLMALEDMEPRGLPLVPAIADAVRAFLSAHQPEFYSDVRWHENRNDLVDYAARALFQVDPEGLHTRDALGAEPHFSAVLARWVTRGERGREGERAAWALKLLEACGSPGPEACALLIRGLNAGRGPAARRSARGLGVLSASSSAARRALASALRHREQPVRDCALAELRAGARRDFEVLEGIVQALEAGTIRLQDASPFPWEAHRGARRVAAALARAAKGQGRERAEAFHAMARLARAAAAEKRRLEHSAARHARGAQSKIDRQLAVLAPAIDAGKRAAEPALRARAFETAIALAADPALLLGEALKDAAERVRLAALKAALRPRPSAALLAILKRATRDPGRSVRRRAWSALERARVDTGPEPG